MAPKREADDSPPSTPENSSKKQRPSTSTATSTIIRSPLKHNINPTGRPAECGIIRTIYVEEFMCHPKLTIKLCQNVNFIYGQNGSGKSAILAALQICLGVGAKRTNRARNLKELVRKEDGATHAIVRVTLLNKGPDAFQHEIYGDTVTIERFISLHGSGGGYKLYGHDDPNHKKPKSTKKEDLNQLLDQLNIQVENPVAVLDQEEAKKFLTGRPEDKYAFFTKATDLERMDRKYGETVDNINELIDALEKMEKAIDPLERNVHVLQKEYEDFKKLEHLEVRAEEANVKWAWSFYTAVLAELEAESKILGEHEARVQRYKDNLAKEEGQGDDASTQIAYEEKLGELTSEATEASEHLSTLHGELKIAISPKKQQEHSVKRKQLEVKSAKKNLTFAMRELQNMRNEVMQKKGSADDEETQRQAKAKKAEEAMEEAKKVVDESRGGIETFCQRYEEGSSREDVANGSLNAVNAQCGAVQRKIQELKASQGNSLTIFGSTCEAMNRAVLQAQGSGKFRGKVIGPIGKYMKIIPGKEHLASVAEKALGLNLDRYIVTNSHDRQVFLKLRQQVRCGYSDSGVYQMTEGARYKIHQPPDDIDVVSSVITSTDDLVFNCMIDNGRSDQKAVCESKQVSEQKLLVETNGKQSIRHRNIKTVYFLPAGDYWQVYNDQLSMTSQSGIRRTSIGIDKSRAIVEAESELVQLKTEKEQKARDLNDVKKDRHGHKVVWNDWKKKERVARDKINKLTDEIERIREEAEAAENVTFDTSDLEDEVNKTQIEYDRLKGEEEELTKAVDDLLPGIQAIQAQIDEVVTRNEKVMEDLNEAEDKLSTHLQGQQQRARNIEKRKKKVEMAVKECQQQLEQTQGKESKMQDTLRKARILTVRQRNVDENRKRRVQRDENGEEDVELVDEELYTEEEINSLDPIIVAKDPEYYVKKMRELKRRIESERKSKRMTESDPEVALEKYMRAKKALDTKMFQIEKIENNRTMLQNDIIVRKKRWRDFRNHIVQMTNHTFDEVLNRKGSSGEINFDHKNKTLNLIVQKDIKDESSQTADVKSLSGGERSYTTLALLLALGESLETPFRVMDEFDVFLDPIARRLALKTMIEVATSFDNRQFIFITPQDLSDIKTHSKLMIKKMTPPERISVLGGAVQQTLD